jgi:hypothetical protein
MGTRDRGPLARLLRRSPRAEPDGAIANAAPTLLRSSAPVANLVAPVAIVSQALGWQAADLRSALGPAWQVRRGAVDSAHLLVVGRADAIVIGPSPPAEVSRLRRRYPRACLLVVAPRVPPAMESTWLEAGADACVLDPDLATLAEKLRDLVAVPAHEAASASAPPFDAHLSGPGSVGPPSPNGAGAGPVGTGPGPVRRPAIAGRRPWAGADTSC